MAGIGQNPADELFADLAGNRQPQSANPADELFADLLPQSRQGPAPPPSAAGAGAGVRSGAFKYGGAPGSKEGTDCSGAMCLIGEQAGLKLPRTARAQFQDKRGQKIASIDELRPGDLVFFGSPGPSGWHVGFYQGAGKMLHQSTDAKPGLSLADVRKHAQKFGWKGGKRFAELAAQYDRGQASMVKPADFAATAQTLRSRRSAEPEQGWLARTLEQAQASVLARHLPEMSKSAQMVAGQLLSEGKTEAEVAHELLRLEEKSRTGRMKLAPQARLELNALVRGESFARSEAIDRDPALDLTAQPAGPVDSQSASRMIRQRIGTREERAVKAIGAGVSGVAQSVGEVAGATLAPAMLLTSGMYGSLNPEEQNAFRNAIEQGAPIVAAGAVANVATAPLLGGLTMADPIAVGLGASIFGYGDQDPLFDALAPGVLRLMAPAVKGLWRGSQAAGRRLNEAAAKGNVELVRKILLGPGQTVADRQMFAELLEKVVQRDRALGGLRQVAGKAGTAGAARSAAEVYGSLPEGSGQRLLEETSGPIDRPRPPGFVPRELPDYEGGTPPDLRQGLTPRADSEAERLAARIAEMDQQLEDLSSGPRWWDDPDKASQRSRLHRERESLRAQLEVIGKSPAFPEEARLADAATPPSERGIGPDFDSEGVTIGTLKPERITDDGKTWSSEWYSADSDKGFKLVGRATLEDLEAAGLDIEGQTFQEALEAIKAALKIHEIESTLAPGERIFFRLADAPGLAGKNFANLPGILDFMAENMLKAPDAWSSKGTGGTLFAYRAKVAGTAPYKQHAARSGPAPDPKSAKGTGETPAAAPKRFTSTDGTSYTREWMNPQDLGVKKGLQYKKQGIVDAENAVTAEFKSTKKWEPAFAGVLTVWEDAQGKRWVMNGHHRRELAIRLGVPEVEVNVYREAEGVTFEKARALGALQNVAGGKGTAIDAAEILKEFGYTRDNLAEFGVSNRGNIGRDASALIKLSDDALDMVRRGEVPEAVGAAIAEADLPPAKQIAALKEARRVGMEGRQAAQILADRARTAKLVSKTDESDLFGEIAEELALGEQALITEAVLKRLAKQKNLFQAMLRGKAAGKTVVDEAAQSQEAEAIELARQWMGTSPEVTQALEKGAANYAQTGKQADFLQAVDDVEAAAKTAVERRLETLKGGSRSAPGPAEPRVQQPGRTPEPVSGEGLLDVEPELKLEAPPSSQKTAKTAKSEPIASESDQLTLAPETLGDLKGQVSLDFEDLLDEFEGAASKDEWDAAVKASDTEPVKRINRTRKQLGGTSLFGNKEAVQAVFRDLSILAGRAIRKGLEFAKWSAGILQSFGREIAQLAQKAWDGAKRFLEAPTSAADRTFAQRGAIAPRRKPGAEFTATGRHVTWRGTTRKIAGADEAAYDELRRELAKIERSLKKSIAAESDPVQKRRLEAELRGHRRDRADAFDEFWKGFDEEQNWANRELSPEERMAESAARDIKVRPRQVEEQIEDPFESPAPTGPPPPEPPLETPPASPEPPAPKPSRSRGKTLADTATGLAGDTFARLRSLGEEGVRMAEQLNKVLADGEHIQATLIDKLERAVRSVYGRGPGLFSPEGRASMETLAKKVVKGQGELTEKEKAVWGAWTQLNDALVKLSGKNKVLVRRVIGYNVPGNLTGESVKFFDREMGKNRFGTVTEVHWTGEGQNQRVTGLTLDVEGRTVQLREQDRIFTRQLVDPEAFFPRQLKEEAWDWIRRPGTAEYEEAVKYLLETKQAKDRAMAIAALEDVHGALDLPTGAPVRLERPRVGVLLPDHFYEWNFAKVTRRHIKQSAMRIAYAQQWGSDGENLLPQLLKLGDDAQTAAQWISDALGFTRGGRHDRAMAKVAALEGSVTAIRLLTGGTSGIVQLSQFINTYGLLGLRPFFKGAYRLAGKRGAALREEILLSGAVTHDDMKAIMGLQEQTAASSLADTALTLVGLKHTDLAARIHGAAAGIAAAEDAIRRLTRAPDGSLKRNAAYRFLRDFALFSEEDVLRMARTREQTGIASLTKQDRRIAIAAGVKTNVRTRTADLPQIASTPLGRMLFRLKTFQYGQAKLFGFTLKEAKRGNVAPLLRLALGGAIGYEGIRRLKGYAISLLEGDDRNLTADNERFDKAIAGAVKHLREGDFNKAAGSLMDRAWSNFILGNFTGLYGLPAEAKELQERFPHWKEPDEIMGQQFIPPGFQPVLTAISIGIAISRSERNFFENLKRGGVDLAYREIPAFKRLYRRFHKGRRPKKVK